MRFWSSAAGVNVSSIYIKIRYRWWHRVAAIWTDYFYSVVCEWILFKLLCCLLGLCMLIFYIEKTCVSLSLLMLCHLYKRKCVNSKTQSSPCFPSPRPKIPQVKTLSYPEVNEIRLHWFGTLSADAIVTHESSDEFWIPQCMGAASGAWKERQSVKAPQLAALADSQMRKVWFIILMLLY